MVVESFHLLDSSSDSESSEQSTSTASSDASSSNYMEHNSESSAAQTDNLKELIGTLTRGRSFKGLTRMCSSKYRRKGVKVPNYLKATKCSDVRKLNLHASSPNLNAAASSRTTPVTALRRTATLRPKRRLAKLVSLRPRRPSSMKSCSEVSPSLGSGIQRATCSSTFKNSKFPAQMDIIQPGDDVSVISPAAKVCSFSYCSLHGHRHAAAPSLKRLKSARKRVRTQRSKKLGGRCEIGAQGLLHNSITDVEEKDNARNESRHCRPSGSAESTGQPDSSRSEGGMPRNVSALSGELTCHGIEESAAGGEEMMDKFQCVDEVGHIDSASRTEESKSAETATATVVEERAADGTTKESVDGTSIDSAKASLESRKLNGLWSLLYHHMASDVAENGGLESPLYPSEMTQSASPDEADQQEELRQSDAVKMLQEALNKILAQTQNGSKESSAITSNLDEEKLKPVIDAAKKPNPLVSKRWSSLKKYVLMRRFIKAMEKMRTFSPRMPRTRSSGEYPEHEKVSLRSRSMEERKGTEEFMLDYALRKVISGLGPAQKRKVALLVHAFETMNPVPGSGSHLRPTGSFSSLSIHSQVSAVSSSVDGDIGTESVVGSTDWQGEIPDIVEAVEEFRDENSFIDSELSSDQSNSVESTTAIQLNATSEEVASESDSSNGDSMNASFGRRKLTGLWRLIHQQVLSDVAENGGLESRVHRLSTKEEEEKQDGYDWAATPDEAGQQEELRETEAIKLLRDAITRILAQSQNCSSNGAIVSEKAATREINCEGTISPDVEEEQLSVDKTLNINKKPIIDAAKKPNPLVSKRWSNVKRYVLMRRFITAMEKMRTFSPRMPRSLSTEEYSEQERVNLRRQSIEGRKNTEEWMLDYALRKVISELEPAQKRKVALLVHAFETMNPVPGSGSHLKLTGSYTSLAIHSQASMDSSEEGDASESLTGEVHKIKKYQASTLEHSISEDIGTENGVVSKDVEEDHGKADIASNTNNGEGYQEEVQEVVEIVQGCRDEEGQGTDQASLIDSAQSSELYSSVESNREAGVGVCLAKILSGTKGGTVIAREKVDENPQFPEKPESYSDSGDSVKASLGSRKFSGLWYMIHQQMVSEVAENGGLASPVHQVSIQGSEEDRKKLPEINGSGFNSPTSETSGAATPEEAIQQSDVIKLLREAVNKILAQTEKESLVRQTSNEGMSEEMVTGESTAKGMKSVKDAVRMSPNPLVSKRWSNVKKYVLMRRFIKSMEKMRTFRPRIPRSASSEVSAEQEKVSLRSQSIGERKNSEEWMLDYALRKVISELDPPQQRKVGLLVQAFEKVSPFPGSESQIKPSVQNVAEIGIEHGVSSKTLMERQIQTNQRELITETRLRGGEESGPHPSAAAGDEPGSGSTKENGLWLLIYKRMASGLESEGATEPPPPIVDGNKEENKVEQVMESEGIRQSKLDAVKLVQQAIDEILLPENEDSLMDDQDTAKGTIPEKGPENKCSCEARDLSSGENTNEHCVQSTSDSQPKSDAAAKLEGTTEHHQEVTRSVTAAGKNWNNLRKAILLKRFVKALERVRTFNPQQPRHLPLEPDEDPEKVNLRRQDSEDRKNGEEYLLDYALQQVVSKLTPARKKKVHLLVQAFETITPNLGK